MLCFRSSFCKKNPHKAFVILGSVSISTSGDNVQHLPQHYLSDLSLIKTGEKDVCFWSDGDAWVTLSPMKANVTTTYYSIFLGWWQILESAIYRHIPGRTDKVATYKAAKTSFGNLQILDKLVWWQNSSWSPCYRESQWHNVVHRSMSFHNTWCRNNKRTICLLDTKWGHM